MTKTYKLKTETGKRGRQKDKTQIIMGTGRDTLCKTKLRLAQTGQGKEELT